MTGSTRVVEQVLAAADAAYYDGELRLTEDIARGGRGDTLAEFIVIEIREVSQGMEGEAVVEVVLAAMERARDELSKVCEAIRSVEVDCGED